MPGGMLMAARAGNRMQARQTYRTINRMDRRRDSYYSPPYYEPPQLEAPRAPLAAPAYAEELERIAHLHAQGYLTDQEYAARKRQLLT